MYFRYQENLKVHSIRVMAVIEKMLHRLDDPRRSALVCTVCDRPFALQLPGRVKKSGASNFAIFTHQSHHHSPTCLRASARLLSIRKMSPLTSQILVDYGRRHYGYGVKELMLEYMAQSFIIAIQPSLEESYVLLLQTHYIQRGK